MAMHIADLDDLFAPEVNQDPFSYFAHLRATDPVHWNERFNLWVVTRYEDIVWLLRHHELFSSAVIKTTTQPPYPPVDPEDVPLYDDVKRFRAEQLVEKDRPEHLDMRKVVHKYFTPTKIDAWRPFVRDAVTELLDDIEPRGRMDVLTDLAASLPVRVIAQMMGVPYEDRDHLRELADKILWANRGESYRLRVLTEGMQGLLEYTTPLVEERLERSTNDFISVLVEGEKIGVLSRYQVLVNTALLLFAGHETTMNLICNGLLAFIRHPEQWEQLCGDPAGLARSAVEECLRFDPPVKSTQRVAAQDVELRGKTIRSGDRIRWIIAAANRDPDVFSAPDHFDIGRHPNPHIAFGSGTHYCLGVTLARMEGQEVFRALAERFSRFTLETNKLEYQPSLQFRSLKSLPVSWTKEDT